VKRLRIATGLDLPAEEFVSSATGIIGKRGRGKTGAVKRIQEECVRVGLPFVSFDPVGVAWGIRSSFDGSGPGLPVLVVGGPHGDVRLDRRAGDQVARSIVQANVPAVIDFSEEPKRAYREFVRDFSHTLFTINDTPRLVIVEEAPELVPQRPRPDMMEVLEAVERLVRLGRNKAIGVVLVSQRTATISKDVLSQIDLLLAFGVVAPQDKKAIREWVEEKGQEEKYAEFEDGLSKLGRREAWAWAPEAFGGIFRQVRIRDFHTFHPDKTHLARLKLLAVKPTTTDVSGIVGKLGTAMERLAKEKDAGAELPRLREKVRKLEAMAALVKEQSDLTQSYKPLRYEVESLRGKRDRLTAALKEANELRREAAWAISGLRKNLEGMSRMAGASLEDKRVQGLMERLGKPIESVAITTFDAPLAGRESEGGTERSTPQRATFSPSDLAANPPPAERRMWLNRRDGTGEHLEDVALKSGAVRILRELASRYPASFTRSQLGTLSGFTPSGGTFGTYFGQLKRIGFVEEDGRGDVRATQKGMEFVGEVPPAPTSPHEVVVMWKSKFKRGAGEMLQALVDAHPDGLTREDLAEKTGFEVTGGTFGTYLSMLIRNGVAETTGNGVRASDSLFAGRDA